MRMVLVAIALAACGDPPQTAHHRIFVIAEDGLPERLGDVDDALDALAAQLDAAGLLSVANAHKFAWDLMVEWRHGDPIECTLPGGNNRLVHCCSTGNKMQVGGDHKCIWQTSLTHELTHILMIMNDFGDGDPEHTAKPEWWKAQGKADLALMEGCR